MIEVGNIETIKDQIEKTLEQTLTSEFKKNISVAFDRETGIINVSCTVFLPSRIHDIDVPIKFKEG
jgi:capsule polysaccharide export protein KpsE/RkpR